VRDTNISYKGTKKTIQKETTNSSKKRSANLKKDIAAVSSKINSKQENYPDKEIHHQQELNVPAGQNKLKLEDNQTFATKQESSANCSIKEVKLARSLGDVPSPGSLVKKINSEWRSRRDPLCGALIEELDSLGVQVNKTLVSLVKMYSEEEVRKAIALLKIRKKEKFIPNMAGYFTAALKGGWSYKSVVDETAYKEGEGIDKASVFRLWYELAKELGYCNSQEVREGEQWVLLSGNWERWENACNRGYSLDYLKTVMRRNKGQ
jgi:hypothetical protein